MLPQGCPSFEREAWISCDKICHTTHQEKYQQPWSSLSQQVFFGISRPAFHLNFPLYLTEAANVSNGAVVGAWVVVVVKQESHRLGFFHGSPALASALSHSTFPDSDKQGEDVPAVDLSIDSTEI